MSVAYIPLSVCNGSHGAGDVFGLGPNSAGYAPNVRCRARSERVALACDARLRRCLAQTTLTEPNSENSDVSPVQHESNDGSDKRRREFPPESFLYGFDLMLRVRMRTNR